MWTWCFSLCGLGVFPIADLSWMRTYTGFTLTLDVDLVDSRA